ncbi:MAG: ABC transporter ATP-binding protein, partial [Patescibacteria group bacterium]
SASFDIKPGEFVAIMGPSGSGKSTLLHILSFMDRPTSGSYSFSGEKIEDLSDSELAHIRNKEMGFVFQAFNLLSRSSVYSNVEMPLIYSDVPESKRKELVEKAVSAVGLSEKLNVESGKLSGGQKQRVAIARALVNDPDIIFADEPTGNLDSRSGENIMRILKRLNGEGKTIILVTHETYTAQFAKRLIRLKDGEIELDGLISEHFANSYESK